MSTNRAIESDPNIETPSGIVMVAPGTSIDRETRRRSTENSTANEHLDTYFADEKIHIPHRVRIVHTVYTNFHFFFHD